MKLAQAKKLSRGDILYAKVRVPQGGESRWNSESCIWEYQPIETNAPLTFGKRIPKVRVVNREPWQDSHKTMLLCYQANGERAWLNISNAERGGQ